MNKKYNSIQLMRAIASLSVVFAHIFMFFNGVFGVDLFFCISGFIVMHTTERNEKHFLQKRAIRIIPLYWLATIISAVLMIIVPNVFRAQEFRFEFLLKSLLFIPYYFTAPNGTTLTALFALGWTLICEVIFCILFFISMKINHKYRQVISTAFLLLLVIIGFTVYSENVFIFFYCSPFILEFALGMFAFKFMQIISKVKITDRHFVLFGSLALLIWAGLFAQKYISFFDEVDRFIKYGIPTFLFFMITFKMFENRNIPNLFIFIGDISYSLYITHYFVVQGFSRLIYNIDEFTIIGAILAIFIVIPVAICVAWISWFIFEYKFTGWLMKKLNVTVQAS